MGVARAVVLLASLPSVLSGACTSQLDRSSASRIDSLEQASSLGYGWSTPISTRDADKGVATRDGRASHKIEGHSIRQIVNSPKVRVRRDNEACVTCHSWAAWSDRQDFCARVDAFLAMPTSKDDRLDSAGAKPPLVKKLLRDWKDADCPD